MEAPTYGRSPTRCGPAQAQALPHCRSSYQQLSCLMNLLTFESLIVPQQARIVPKNRSRAKPLPGWGTEGGDWAELDKLEGLSSETAAVSKVAAELTELKMTEDSTAAANGTGEAAMPFGDDFQHIYAY